MKAVRPLSVGVGTALLSAWFVSLAVHASVGAIDPIAPRYAASGDLPAALPSLKPLVLPQRDPFAADVVRLPTASVLRGPGGIANVQVPDPAAFARGAAASLGVIGVIVGDRDAYALVEDGAQIQVVHVHDAFAGSEVTAIGQRGVTLANGVTLDIDAQPSRLLPGLPTALGGIALPSPEPTGSGAPIRAGFPPGVIPIGPGALIPPSPAAVATPLSVAPGISVPAPMYSASAGSLFPLLSPPAPP